MYRYEDSGNPHSFMKGSEDYKTYEGYLKKSAPPKPTTLPKHTAESFGVKADSRETSNSQAISL